VARALDVVFDDRLALLSNIPEELASHYENHHSRLEMFQVRGFSCRIGHAKPDPAAFRWSRVAPCCHRTRPDTLAGRGSSDGLRHPRMPLSADAVTPEG
jgi:hypothetical protein